MPTYQYSCTHCGHFFEQFQSFSDDSLTVCPQCEGQLRKVFNAVGVVFKGSGFYRTDSRSASAPKDGSKESPKESPKGTPKPAESAPAAAATTSTAASPSASGSGSSTGSGSAA